MNKRKQLSVAYLRWKKQLSALHEGKLRTVKMLAYQARQEIKLKTNGQLVLSFIR